MTRGQMATRFRRRNAMPTRDEWPFPLLLILVGSLIFAAFGESWGLTTALLVAVPLVLLEIGRVAER